MTSLRRALPGLFFIALVIAATLPLAAAREEGAPFRSDQKFANGLWMMTFNTPQGQIRLNLPERLRQGELASATIELYPKGKGQAFADNLAALQAYTLRIDGEDLAASSRTLRWRLPSQPNSRIELVDSTGTAVIDTPATITNPDGQRPAGRYVLPELVQRGNTFIVRGPFDGDFATTQVLLGGKPAEKIAESSDLLVVRNTAEQLGRTRAVVIEGTARQRAAFNSFDMRLSAPNGAAAPGSNMAIRMVLEGLAGVQKPFQVALYNHHPEVASFEGGASPLLRTVETEQIGADGAFQLDLTIRVKTAGQMGLLGIAGVQTAQHVTGFSWPPHTANVTFPPGHAPNFSWPDHTTNVTFPPYHAVNITFPPHYLNVTFPPGHVPGITWPPHLNNATFPPHAVNVTFAPHYTNVTFPNYHVTNVSWPPHYPGVTFPPGHQTGTTWPPHFVGFSFQPMKDDKPIGSDVIER